MPQPPLSIRLSDSTLARLDAQAKRNQLPPRTLAQRYIDEGLRMDEHPLIRFVDGPAGRRATVIGSGDVWEVIATVLDNDGDVVGAADYLQVSAGLVQAAIVYYGQFKAEIDEWIEQNARESESGHTAWIAGLDALKR